MPVSTITPLNGTQSSLLANALNGSTAAFGSLLNQAIQRSRDDLSIQTQQEQQFFEERQRSINNERIERFDQRNRQEFAANFARQLKNDSFINRGREINNERSAFNLQNDITDRGRAEDLSVTRPELDFNRERREDARFENQQEDRIITNQRNEALDEGRRISNERSQFQLEQDKTEFEREQEQRAQAAEAVEGAIAPPTLLTPERDLQDQAVTLQQNIANAEIAGDQVKANELRAELARVQDQINEQGAQAQAEAAAQQEQQAVTQKRRTDQIKTLTSSAADLTEKLASETDPAVRDQIAARLDDTKAAIRDLEAGGNGQGSQGSQGGESIQDSLGKALADLGIETGTPEVQTAPPSQPEPGSEISQEPANGGSAENPFDSFLNTQLDNVGSQNRKSRNLESVVGDLPTKEVSSRTTFEEAKRLVAERAGVSVREIEKMQKKKASSRTDREKKIISKAKEVNNRMRKRLKELQDLRKGRRGSERQQSQGTDTLALDEALDF